MISKALLYPQSIFYPYKSLRFLNFVERIYLIELPETKTNLIRQLKDEELSTRIGFISLKEPFKVRAEELKILARELQDFGTYIRTPESLRYFYLHKDLFEETFANLFKDKNPPESFERALLVLILAEKIDRDLWDVSCGLQEFSQNWRKILEEMIIFKNLYEETETFFYKAIEEKDVERLWSLKNRLLALRELWGKFLWAEELQDMRTLLITERELLEDFSDGSTLIEEQRLSNDVILRVYAESLNPKIGLPLAKGYPQFREILIIL